MTMNNFGTGNTGNLALVNSLQSRGTVAPAPPENLGSRVLELSSILQTTLDIEQQIELFGKEIQRYLSVDGLTYSLPNDEQNFTFGREASERASYSLVLHEKPLGTIRVCRERPYNQRELTSLENLLCSLIYPLHNALAYKHAVEMASRDPLTGAHNRLAMDGTLTREIDLARRQDQSLSILVVDVDHFKSFNDNHGHAFGDDVLVAISQTIASTVRRCDLVFRYGGEEFVVLASCTCKEGATLLAERIRENIAAMQTVRGRSVNITASIGVAELIDEDDEEAFFSRADKALYKAKHNGRNQTVIAA